MKPLSQLETIVRNFAYTFSRVGGEVVIGLLLTPLLIRGLGLDVFGLLVTIGASGMLLATATRAVQQSVARQLGYSLGAGDEKQLRVAFSSAFVLQLAAASLLAFVAIVAAPSLVGFLTVPEGLEDDARICFVLTVLQFSIAVFASPFSGSIIARQDLRLISLAELAIKVVTLLGAVAMLYWPGSKLIFFASVQLAAVAAVNIVYIHVARSRYAETRTHFRGASLATMRSMLSFGTFAFIGVVGTQLRRNGITVFMNVAYGNVASAAYGIAVRLAALVTRIMGSVRTVILPAMTVNTGSSNRAVTTRLLSLSSMLAFCISLPVAMPILTDTRALLQLWLRIEVPDLAVVFTQLLVLSFLVRSVSQGHSLAMHADGRIGVLVVVGQGIVLTCVALFCVYAIRFDVAAHWVLVGELLGIFLSGCVWQPYWTRRQLLGSHASWLRYAVLPMAVVSASCLVFANLVNGVMESSLLRAVTHGIVTLGICALVFVALCVTPPERKRLLSYAQSRISRRSSPA